MPQATALIVKNGALVDKTFDLLSPAAGYGGVAEWALKEGSIASVFPRFTASATRQSGRSSKLRMKLTVPASFNDAVTGLTNVGETMMVEYVVVVPEAFPEDKKADAVAFATNLINSTLVMSMVRDASPAT